jgi:hypothetical protein
LATGRGRGDAADGHESTDDTMEHGCDTDAVWKLDTWRKWNDTWASRLLTDCSIRAWLLASLVTRRWVVPRWNVSRCCLSYVQSRTCFSRWRHISSVLPNISVTYEESRLLTDVPVIFTNKPFIFTNITNIFTNKPILFAYFSEVQSHFSQVQSLVATIQSYIAILQSNITFLQPNISFLQPYFSFLQSYISVIQPYQPKLFTNKPFVQPYISILQPNITLLQPNIPVL